MHPVIAFFITYFSQVNGIPRSLTVSTFPQQVKQDFLLKSCYKFDLQCWGNFRSDPLPHFPLNYFEFLKYSVRCIGAAQSMFAEQSVIITKRIISQSKWICICNLTVKWSYRKTSICNSPQFREANSHCVYDCVCFKYVESWGAEKGQLYSHEKRQIYIIQFLQDRAMQ